MIAGYCMVKVFRLEFKAVYCNAVLPHSIMAAADSAVVLLELNDQWD